MKLLRLSIRFRLIGIILPLMLIELKSQNIVNFVADGMGYELLQDAIDSVSFGGTIYMLRDVEMETSVQDLNGGSGYYANALINATSNKDITIDLGGHTLSCSSITAGHVGVILICGGNVTIQNGRIEDHTNSTATMRMMSALFSWSGNANVTLDNLSMMTDYTELVQVHSRSSCIQYVNVPRVPIVPIVPNRYFTIPSRHLFPKNLRKSYKIYQKINFITDY